MTMRVTVLKEICVAHLHAMLDIDIKEYFIAVWKIVGDVVLFVMVIQTERIGDVRVNSWTAKMMLTIVGVRENTIAESITEEFAQT